MRKNIRRSLTVAAVASGVWVLGTAGAEAAEPAGHPVTGVAAHAGQGGDLGEVLEDAAKTVRKTTKDLTREVVEKLPLNGIPENGLPAGAPSADRPPSAAGGGTVGTARTKAGPAVREQPAVQAADRTVTGAVVRVNGTAVTPAPPTGSTVVVRAHAAVPGVSLDGAVHTDALGADTRRDTDETVVHVTSGVQTVTAPYGRGLTDAANIPGLPAVPVVRTFGSGLVDG